MTLRCCALNTRKRWKNKAKGFNINKKESFNSIAFGDSAYSFVGGIVGEQKQGKVYNCANLNLILFISFFRIYQKTEKQ